MKQDKSKRIAKIKAQVKDRSYHVDSSKIADAMMSCLNDTPRFGEAFTIIGNDLLPANCREFWDEILNGPMGYADATHATETRQPTTQASDDPTAGTRPR